MLVESRIYLSPTQRIIEITLNRTVGQLLGCLNYSGNLKKFSYEMCEIYYKDFALNSNKNRIHNKTLPIQIAHK